MQPDTRSPTGPVWPNGGIHPPALGRELAAFLTQSLTVYDRSGGVVAHLGPPEGLLGRGSHFLDIAQFCHPDDRPRLTEITAAVIDSPPGWCGGGMLRLQRADRSWGVYEVQAWNQRGEEPFDGIVVRMAEAISADGPSLFGPVAVLGLEADPSIAAAARTAALTLDRDGLVRHVTPAAEQLLGWRDTELYGRPVATVVSADDQALVAGQTAAMGPREERTIVASLITRSGDHIPTEVRLIGGVRDPISLVTLVLTDRRREPELVRMATTDPLTGLANRARLLGVLDGRLGSGHPVSVLYADVDGLKQMNDTFGHAVGDELLAEVAQVLRSSASEGCTVGRIGGDEFVIVGPGGDPDRIEAVADRLRRQGPISVGGIGAVTVSVGVARSRPGDSAASLLARADAAMFREKRGGREEDRPFDVSG